MPEKTAPNKSSCLDEFNVELYHIFLPWISFQPWSFFHWVTLQRGGDDRDVQQSLLKLSYCLL